ncbi:hypothetical protein YPPY93_1850, partial [Yersinia pestis PY-93]
MPCKNWLGQQ